ncbi:MAG: hypothetical protein WAM14_24245 [Candidatus Nitrosopolaris sp.]
MTKYLIFTISALIIVLLLALYHQNIIIDSKAFAQLPVPNVKSNTSRLANPSSAVASNNNAIITIHTTNSIQGNNFNVIKQEEPVIRKVILSNIDNAIFIAKGSVKSAIPVNVNAKIINQVANSRVDTTQGIDMTKRLTATELINAINTTTTNSNVPFHLLQQPTKVAVDDQAICTGIASASKATCSFTIDIHN